MTTAAGLGYWFQVMDLLNSLEEVQLSDPGSAWSPFELRECVWRSEVTGPLGWAGCWVLLDDFVTSSEVGQIRNSLLTLVMLALGFFGLVVPGGS